MLNRTFMKLNAASCKTTRQSFLQQNNQIFTEIIMWLFVDHSTRIIKFIYAFIQSNIPAKKMNNFKLSGLHSITHTILNAQTLMHEPTSMCTQGSVYLWAGTENTSPGIQWSTGTCWIKTCGISYYGKGS